MKITKLTANWYAFTQDGGGEDYDIYEVGKKGVVSITTYSPYGVERYDVIYDTGEMLQVSNPNKVYFEKDV